MMCQSSWFCMRLYRKQLSTKSALEVMYLSKRECVFILKVDKIIQHLFWFQPGIHAGNSACRSHCLNSQPR